MNGPKLEIIALCNYADFSKDGKLSIVGIFDQIYANKFPSQLLRGFLVLTFSNPSVNKEINLSITIDDPRGEMVLKQIVKANTGTKGKGNIIFELVNMPLKTNGEYKIVINNEEEKIGELKFSAIEVPIPQPKVIN